MASAEGSQWRRKWIRNNCGSSWPRSCHSGKWRGGSRFRGAPCSASSKGWMRQYRLRGSASDSGNGLPVVDTGKLTPAEADAVRADFWELIEWWRERKLQRVYES